MILSIDLCPSSYPSSCSIDLFHRFIDCHHWDVYRDFYRLSSLGCLSGFLIHRLSIDLFHRFIDCSIATMKSLERYHRNKSEEQNAGKTKDTNEIQF